MKHETTTHYQTDEAKIRALFEDLLRGLGQGRRRGLRLLFTEDADYVAFDGTRTTGRREISESHQRLFDKFLKGTRLTGRILSIKFRAPTWPSSTRPEARSCAARRSLRRNGIRSRPSSPCARAPNGALPRSTTAAFVP